MNAVDINVFIYAIDSSEPVKGPQALAFLDRLSANDTVLPWQVLCEFAAVISKLQSRGLATLDPMDAAAALRARFPLVMPDPSMLDAAVGLRRATASPSGTRCWWPPAPVQVWIGCTRKISKPGRPLWASGSSTHSNPIDSPSPAVGFLAGDPSPKR